MEVQRRERREGKTQALQDKHGQDVVPAAGLSLVGGCECRGGAKCGSESLL